MAPNPEPDHIQNEVDESSGAAKEAVAGRTATEALGHSRELVSTGLNGRLALLPGVSAGQALASIATTYQNVIGGDALRALTRSSELVANPFASELKRLTDSVALLPKFPSVADQVGIKHVKALNPALVRTPLPPELPALAPSRELVVPPVRALGLAEARRLARLTTGLNDALFQPLSSTSELLRQVGRVGDFGGRTGWDLTTRVRISLEAARAAAIRGDIEDVEAFADRWLDLPRTRRRPRMLALAEALIWLDAEHLESDRAWGTLRDLERDVRRNVRNRKLLGDVELGGGPVYYLEDMKSTLGEDRALGRCPQTPPLESAVVGLDDFDAMRIGMVLARLDAREQAIVLAKGQPDGKRTGGISWEKAAQDVGALAKDGRRVAAKARRVAVQIMAELENAAEFDGTLR